MVQMTDELTPHSQLRQEFWDHGLVYPELPMALHSELMAPKGFERVTTKQVDLDPMAGYGLEFGGNGFGRDLHPYLEEAEPFFVSAARSNGYSSQWGFAVRSGPLFVSVQKGLVLGRRQGDRGSQLNRATCAFNDLLAGYLVSDSTDPSVAVLLSSYRGYAFVLSKNPNHCVVMGDEIKLIEGFRVPDDWGLVAAFDSGGLLSATSIELHRRTKGSAVLRAAVAFLRIVASTVEYPSSRYDFGYSFIDRRSMRTIPLSIGIGRDETLVLSKPNLSDVGAKLASTIADADRHPTQPFDFPDLLPGCMTVIRPNIDSTTLRAGFSARRLGGPATARGLINPE